MRGREGGMEGGREFLLGEVRLHPRDPLNKNKRFPTICVSDLIKPISSHQKTLFISLQVWLINILTQSLLAGWHPTHLLYFTIHSTKTLTNNFPGGDRL